MSVTFTSTSPQTRRADATGKLDQPEVRERFTAAAGQVRQGTPEQLGAYIKEQFVAYRKESQAAGIKPE